MAAKTASLSVNIIADAAKAKAGLKEAETAFGKFRSEVGNAQGAMGKFQAISGSAFDYVKKNAVGFATAAATAIGTFVATSVMKFQDLALAAGKFSDATGLTTQEASRFIEVAGDMGVEAGSLETALNKMNKAAASGAQGFQEIGAQIVRTSGGAVDVQKTFFNVVDALNNIKDPALRAKAATELLGKGWMDLAEIIGGGSSKLQNSLKSVAEIKVIDPKEVEQARQFRANMDNLKDSVEEFSLSVGQKVLPVVTDFIDELASLADVLNDLPAKEQSLNDEYAKRIPFLQRIGTELAGYALQLVGVNLTSEKTTEVTMLMATAWQQGYAAMIAGKTAADQLAAGMIVLAEDTATAKAKWDEFRGALNFDAEYLRIEENIEAFRVKWAGTTDEAKRKSKEYQQELLNAQIQLANFALQIVGVATTAQNNVIRFYTQTGQLSQALSLINAIKAGLNDLAGRVTPDRVERIVGGLTAPTSTSGITSNQSTVYIPRIPGMAAGGTVTKSGMSLVGENGPELLNLPRGASVIPDIPSMGGQTVINIRVDAGLVSSPDQVGAQIIDAIRRAERRSGQVFASV